MKMMITLLVLALATGITTSLNPIEIKGFKFFESVTGEEMVVRGIDYYPRPNTGDLNHNSLDLFTEEHRHIWERDIPYLKELGVNAVRLYAVDASQNHDAFMCAMNEAGIYVLVALAHDCPTCAITRDEAPLCYPSELKLQGQAVIQAFAKYPNTLGFSAGNEVNHFAPPDVPQWNAPCQKKFLRDMREYMYTCSALRRVPVGLVSADSNREETALYYNCQSDPDDPFENAEWYGLNSYVACNGLAGTYSEAPGFQLLAQSFEQNNYSIPVMLTEFGCLSDTFPEVDGYAAQRKFLDAKWMLEEPSLRDQFSGGFAFEYSIEMENAKSGSPFPFTRFGQQNYGVGYLSPEDCNDVDVFCDYNPLPSYRALRDAYTQAHPPPSAVYTKDTFHVPVDRQARSPCPEQFPPLHFYNWPTDTTRSLECPTKEQAAFVCPNTQKQPPLPEKKHEIRFSSLIMIVIVLGTTIIALLLLVLILYRRRDAVPSTILAVGISFSKSEDSDNISEESEGLLSLQRLSKEETDYHAIHSLASSDDLESL